MGGTVPTSSPQENLGLPSEEQVPSSEGLQWELAMGQGRAEQTQSRAKEVGREKAALLLAQGQHQQPRLGHLRWGFNISLLGACLGLRGRA